MLIINPPIMKPSEPPAGIARICGALKSHGIPFTFLDANLEGIRYLLGSPVRATDTWTIRAVRNARDNMQAVTNPLTYGNPDRYTQVVTELNRVVHQAALPSGVRVTLADYHDERLLPVRSGDLVRSAEHPELNPFFPYFEKRLTALMEAEHISLIGFSLSYLSQALCAFAMIGFCRRINPGAAIVMGGSLVTSWMSNPAWKNPFAGLVDELVAGPGEDWLVSRLSLPEKIPLSGERYRPWYNGLSGKSYFSPGFIAPYSASRGCFWRKCSFCPEKAENNPFLPLKETEVLKDIEFYLDTYNPALVHFCDNAMSPRLLGALAGTSRPVPWYGFTRITAHFLDPDFCVALKRSGCVMLKLGLESGDQLVLDDLNKGIDLETMSRSLRNLGKAGIGTYVYLLFGTVTETLHEARNTLAFTVRHAGCINFLNAAIFNLPAFGPDSDLLDVSSFYEGDLSLYSNFRHPKGWGRFAVRKFLQSEFTKEPAIAAILRRTPPFFTSNHAAFFIKTC